MLDLKCGVRLGERFFPTSDAYTLELRKLAWQVLDELNMKTIAHEGVYAHVGGPSFETPAECRLLKLLGGDVVGKVNTLLLLLEITTNANVLIIMITPCHVWMFLLIV